MSGQVKITDVLKHHEMRLRKIEQQDGLTSNNEQSATPITPSTINDTMSKEMACIKNIAVQLTSRQNKTSNDIVGMHENMNKLNGQMSNLYELFIMCQKEFLQFKQQFEETNKVELIVTEKEGVKVDDSDEVGDEDSDEDGDEDSDEDGDEDSDEDSDEVGDEDSDEVGDEDSDEVGDEDSDNVENLNVYTPTENLQTL